MNVTATSKVADGAVVCAATPRAVSAGSSLLSNAHLHWTRIVTCSVPSGVAAGISNLVAESSAVMFAADAPHEDHSAEPTLVLNSSGIDEVLVKV